MSFEPASPINLIVCDQCQGQGCPACDSLGVYATMEEQTIGFCLPDFIDLKTRKFLRRWLIIKRAALMAAAIIIIVLLRQLIYA
jgi:hypothetical protein